MHLNLNTHSKRQCHNIKWQVIKAKREVSSNDKVKMIRKKNHKILTSQEVGK